MFKWSNFSGSLLVRSVYLITLPIVLVQVVGIIIFFELHWDLVLKRSAQSIANEIKILELNKDDEEIDKFAVRAYDPVAMEEAKHDLGDTITYCESDMDAVQGADALALITEWTEFRVPNWEKVGAAIKTKVVFDGRNLYRSAIVAEAGFDYYGIGMGENIAGIYI